MKSILTGATIALVLVAVVYTQAGLTGKWQGETKMGTQIMLDLKAAGKALTGVQFAPRCAWMNLVARCRESMVAMSSASVRTSRGRKSNPRPTPG